MKPPVIAIIAAEGREFTINGESVTVREMKWTDTLDMIADVADVVLKVGSGGFIKDNAVNVVALAGVIVQSRDVVANLIQRATGKDAAWTAGQSPRAVLALVIAAIEVNASDEIKELGNKLGRAVGFGAAAKKETTPTSAT